MGRRQLADLAAIGLTWDAAPEWQSEHPDRYGAVIEGLMQRDLVYECFCSRKDILNAPRAPHAPEGPIPAPAGPDGAPSAHNAWPRVAHLRLRLRAEANEYTVTDLVHGSYTGVVDDFVLRRGDGVAAYNLAVVVDDAHAGIDQVVRGDDLLSSSPRQAYLAALLGYPEPVYGHVPLAP